MKKNVFVMGSTGSIGVQSLDVISKSNSHKVIGLSCYSNSELLLDQIKEYRPQIVAIDKIDSSHELFDYCHHNDIKVYSGENSSSKIPFQNIDLAINAIVGTSGLKPTVELIKNGIDIALSNKESLVLGGHFIMPLAKKNNVKIIPVDSEHSAIFQCLHGESHSELVEALWLFDIDIEQIEITIHPQSIIHSMVEFIDGSYKAHLGTPDMKVPIQYALTYPARKTLAIDSLDLSDLSLAFQSPDYKRYPILGLVHELIKLGGNRVAVMSIANDYIVQKFLDEKISFNQIFILIKEVVSEFGSDDLPSLEDLLILDENIKLYLEPN